MSLIKLCHKNNIHPQLVTLILDGLKKAKPSEGTHHITGQNLCEAIRDICINEYGALAQTVLEHYGIRSTKDIGQAVFALIKLEILAQSSNDKIEDFIDVFDFEEAFNIDKYVETL